MVSKSFWFAFALVLVIGWEVGFLSNSYFRPNAILAARSKPTPTPLVTPTPTPLIGVPQTLIIPTLNIHAAVESVGLVDNVRMDVPKNTVDVAWYNVGPRPGEVGNVVIDGHYDDVTGAPAVFYSLKNMHQNDVIQIIDDQNNLHLYRVSNVQSFADQNFPFGQIFGKSDRENLYLITCDGVWDREEHNYLNRLVVTATMEK